MEPPTRFERVKEDYKSTILPLELQGRKTKGWLRMQPAAKSGRARLHLADGARAGLEPT